LNFAVKTTVFLKDMNDFSKMNAIYSEFFPENPPARSTIAAAALPKDALVEIEVIAMLQRRAAIE
jgi:2-iminobutanoate/2-iminopropanoate deaminase